MEERGYEAIETDVDHYWELDGAEKYNIDHVPKKELLVGQISDDLENLEELLNDGEIVPTSTHLIWLSAVLRFIGERNDF